MPFIIDIDPVAFRVAGLDIRWYGLTLVLAMLVAYSVADHEARRRRLPAGLLADAVLWVAVASLAGGRLLYMIQNGLPDLAADPAHLLMVWTGGLSFYGGLIAGALALIALARRRGVSWMTALDVAAPAAAIGQAIGHVGCLIGGDSAGVPTTLPWAVIYRNPAAMAPLNTPLHPTQAYEAIALLGLFLALWAIRRRAFMVPGALAATYLGGLAAIRFALFFLRDEPSVLLGLKTAQLIGIAIGISAVGLAVLARRRSHSIIAPSAHLEVVA